VLVVLLAETIESAPLEDFLEPIEFSIVASSSLESCLLLTHDGTSDKGDLERIRLAIEGDFGRSIFAGLNEVATAGASIAERVSWIECRLCLPSSADKPISETAPQCSSPLAVLRAPLELVLVLLRTAAGTAGELILALREGDGGSGGSSSRTGLLTGSLFVNSVTRGEELEEFDSLVCDGNEILVRAALDIDAVDCWEFGVADLIKTVVHRFIGK